VVQFAPVIPPQRGHNSTSRPYDTFLDLIGEGNIYDILKKERTTLRIQKEKRKLKHV